MAATRIKREVEKCLRIAETISRLSFGEQGL